MKYLKTLIQDVKALFPIGLFFYSPFIMLSTFGIYFFTDLRSYRREVIAFGLFTSVLFVIVSLFKSVKIKKCLMLLFDLVLSTLVFIKLSFYHQFGAKINASALFVIFETNNEEISGFVHDYINGPILLLFFSLLLLFVFLIRILFFSLKLDNYIFELPKFCFNYIVNRILIFSLLVYSSYLIYFKFYDENIIIEGITSYNEYIDLKEHLKSNLAKEKSENISVVSGNDEATYVVVIGESTSRWHMQLYGYNRETNPLLTEIKDELFVFNNVISPHVHTMLSLEKVLTLSDYKHPNKENNASIVQLANQAGFSTYWLSNQRPVGLYESIPTMIGNAANHKYYVNSDDYTYDAYDEKIFPLLGNILNEKAAKKMIFIHLMGTHGAYLRRYPKNKEYFLSENPRTKFKHNKSLEMVNHYDNAMRYNDSIVRTIIEKVRKENTNSYVLYFSDHGDEVYDTLDFLGHFEEIGSKPMYDVPFVVWLSKEYKQNNNTLLATNDLLSRSYNLEDFIHGFSDLSNISFDQINLSKSIFNSEYIKTNRIIKNGVDYDKE